MPIEKKWGLVILAGAVAVGGIAYAAAAPKEPAAEAPAAESADDADDGEEAIALSAVPAGALDAAKAAVSGITFTEAEREVEGGVTVYSLAGTANGRAYEVEVSADGSILEVEDGDDEDEDDD